MDSFSNFFPHLLSILEVTYYPRNGGKYIIMTSKCNLERSTLTRVI